VKPMHEAEQVCKTGHTRKPHVCMP
jgi:hypothetical protein